MRHRVARRGRQFHGSIPIPMQWQGRAGQGTAGRSASPPPLHAVCLSVCLSHPSDSFSLCPPSHCLITRAAAAAAAFLVAGTDAIQCNAMHHMIAIQPRNVNLHIALSHSSA